ncbi:unnamed protein product [Polarella glacialis]|uniref:Uncharacterized protein n=1 Tax=Polarella glacialis TaxID=89957 RepID=A0A813DY96_POLGL|nr:unnamed protein product [Polarella glacialis]CAE8701009.1 unnamed protein product [Polarella glacialis]|mmetsp:Transcript_74442/g.134170  ORF Transcript_74442/g.134170 Transcript_74442/m.134170 type:complete len:190 (+) Transcript_74442:156-725(+)
MRDSSAPADERWGGVLADVRLELEAAGRPAALETPLEVIQSVFMRGKRPIAVPISSRWSGCGGSSPMMEAEAVGGASTSSVRRSPESSGRLQRAPDLKKPSAAPPRPASWEWEGLGQGDFPSASMALASASAPAEPPLKRAKAESAAASAAEVRAAIDAGAVWRSVLSERHEVGAVGTMGGWLSSQGCV